MMLNSSTMWLQKIALVDYGQLYLNFHSARGDSVSNKSIPIHQYTAPYYLDSHRD